MIAELIDSLVKCLESKQPGYEERYIALLAQLATLRDPDIIPQLLACIRDNEREGLMFDIIHTIESFDDDTYTERIVQSAATLERQSPGWSKVIHMRILNSPPTLNAYCRALSTAPQKTRATVAAIVSDISVKHRGLSDACAVVIDTIRQGPENGHGKRGRESFR